MTISNDYNKIIIDNNIKTPEHITEIISLIEQQLISYDSIYITLLNSISMTSSLIMYLIKLSKEDIRIELSITNTNLINLLHDIGLDKAVRIKKLKI